MVLGWRVTSSHTAYFKASLQFQLLSREKGAFQSSTGVEVNFLVLCGFLDQRTRVGNEFAVSGIAEGKSEPEAENYPPSSIRHAENGNETLDQIICTEYWQEKKKACKQSR